MNAWQRLVGTREDPRRVATPTGDRLLAVGHLVLGLLWGLTGVSAWSSGDTSGALWRAGLAAAFLVFAAVRLRRLSGGATRG